MMAVGAVVVVEIMVAEVTNFDRMFTQKNTLGTS
jgi:hypothetical protein